MLYELEWVAKHLVVVGIVNYIDLPLGGGLIVSNLDLIWALVVIDVGL